MSILKSYNIGVIGAGWIAKAHMGFLQETGRANITWIAARNPDNLEKVRSDFNIPNKTHDYHDILKDPAVEVVLIATPPDTHMEIFIEALRAHKHGLLEKPMALTKEELEEMMAEKALYPEIIFYDLDEEGKARETIYARECPKEEDGFFLSRHLIDVLDGYVQPVVAFETAQKHMDIIFSINELNGSN
jgi:shikimate 5-dehydrogenase